MNEEQTRELAKRIYKKEHGNKSPDFWVCGEYKVSTSEKAECSKCKKVVYFDRECINLFDKKVEKICISCALKLDITKLERKILK